MRQTCHDYIRYIPRRIIPILLLDWGLLMYEGLVFAIHDFSRSSAMHACELAIGSMMSGGVIMDRKSRATGCMNGIYGAPSII